MRIRELTGYCGKNAPPLAAMFFNRQKNPPPAGGNVFQPTKTIFELIQDIIRTHVLTKFHEDRTINVASRALTGKNAPPPWLPCFSSKTNPTMFHEDQIINVVSRLKNAPPACGHLF
ncbi:hypothetical protein DPMN_024937 [Dreissena polymorpha]|uniref:Uncharacterized protein n=1 Tax=Dreissena polymorpha TaxID=45954 RepID=A0A9D4LQG4_DREPO|nr:hypothetical protein DPMN_024937 [Dreissena polymorpha]